MALRVLRGLVSQIVPHAPLRGWRDSRIGTRGGAGRLRRSAYPGLCSGTLSASSAHLAARGRQPMLAPAPAALLTWGKELREDLPQDAFREQTESIFPRREHRFAAQRLGRPVALLQQSPTVGLDVGLQEVVDTADSPGNGARRCGRAGSVRTQARLAAISSAGSGREPPVSCTYSSGCQARLPQTLLDRAAGPRRWSCDGRSAGEAWRRGP